MTIAFFVIFNDFYELQLENFENFMSNQGIEIGDKRNLFVKSLKAGQSGSSLAIKEKLSLILFFF